MTEEETAFFEKTFKMCRETQRLVEQLRKDLAALQASAARAQAYNEVAALYLEKAKWDAARKFEDQ